MLSNAQTPISGNQFLSSQLQAMQQDADVNPITLWVEKGQALWRDTCQSCHQSPETLRTSAAEHPRLITRNNSTRLINLEDQINVCRERVGQQPKGLEDNDTLSLSALLHSVAKGQSIHPQPPTDALGKQRWQGRRKPSSRGGEPGPPIWFSNLPFELAKHGFDRPPFARLLLGRASHLAISRKSVLAATRALPQGACQRYANRRSIDQALITPRSSHACARVSRAVVYPWRRKSR